MICTYNTTKSLKKNKYIPKTFYIKIFLNIFLTVNKILYYNFKLGKLQLVIQQILTFQFDRSLIQTSKNKIFNIAIEVFYI